MQWRLVPLIFISVCTQISFAVAFNPLDQLSRGAAFVTGKRCPAYDETQALAQAHLSATQAVCENKNPESLKNQKTRLAELNSALQGDAEDQYFALLANQQSQELQCASDFAAQVSGPAAQAGLTEDIKNKVLAAREAKQKLAAAAQSLATSPTAPTRVCPDNADLSQSPLAANEGLIAALKKELPPDQGFAEAFELCKEILIDRQAYQAILESIPLSAVPSVRELIEKSANEKTDLSATLDADIVLAYQAAVPVLKNESTKMAEAVKNSSAAGFGRLERMALMSDPALSETVLRRGDGQDLRGVACVADAKYGSGAKALDAGAVSASIFFGAAGWSYKAGSAALRTALAARAVRSMGAVSYTSMRVLYATAVLGTDAYLAGKAIAKTCGDHALSNFKTDSACVSAPSLKNLKQDNCILTASLSAIGFTGVAVSVLGKGKIVTTRAPSPAQYTDIERRLAEGKIVSRQAIGEGDSGAEYVVYEDGLEGVFKPNNAKDFSARRELAFYAVDKHLGAGYTPPTVAKTLDGVQGTVQLRIKNLKDLKNAPRQPDELGFIDYLLRNNDRHSKNYLRTEDGKIIAIDNGMALNAESGLTKYTQSLDRFKKNVRNLDILSRKRARLEAKLARNPSKTELAAEITELKLKEAKTQQAIQTFMPEKEVVDKLRATSLEKWTEVFPHDFNPKRLAELADRQKDLLKAVDEAERKIGAEKLYRDGPMSGLLKKGYVPPKKMRFPFLSQ